MRIPAMPAMENVSTGSTEQHGHHLPLDVEVFLHGDATNGTAEKGRIIFEAAVDGNVKLVDELRSWPNEKRADMHTTPCSRRFGGE